MASVDPKFKEGWSKLNRKQINRKIKIFNTIIYECRKAVTALHKLKENLAGPKKLLILGIIFGAMFMTGESVEGGSGPPSSTEDPNLLHSVVYEKEESKIIKANQIIYGYSSRVSETDDDPFTTASGTQVREGIIANNCYPFGQRVRVERRGYQESFWTEYEVTDRMNSRYGCDVWDIWFANTQDALNWGRRILSIEIL